LSSFLLDTSFLISFADPRRPHHSVAKSYIIESLRRGSPLYLSAIVASEFQVKQPVTDLPLRNLVVLPFNIDHAMTAGILMRSLQRDANDDRGNVKDDVKLIAQTVCESIPFILTEDQNTLAKYLKRLNDSGSCSAKAILLTEGFDSAWFNNGQRAIGL
jgi:predicted nucleic acid-binding protein